VGLHPTCLGVHLGVPSYLQKNDTPKMPLTHIQITKAKPKTKPYKIADGGGLFLLVNPSGSKLWRMKYRVDGKEKLLSFGPYPDLSLQNARRARESAREQIALGNDPGQIRREEKEKATALQTETFEAVANLYLEKLEKEGRALTTLSKKRWLLNMAIEDFGQTQVRALTAPIILKTLKKHEGRGVHETAKRLRTNIGEVMRYAVALSMADADPTAALRGALVKPIVKHHAAITDIDNFAGLIRAIDGYDGHFTTQTALKLMPLLYPRPGELRQAEWSEFDFNKGVWEIPAHRMKMRRPHRVPLPPQAIALLEAQRQLTGNYKMVFPSMHTALRPISENTLNTALKRMGYSKEEMTPHGFRASFSTFANESRKWHPDAIERALAHAESNQVRAAYVRGEHWDERVEMADWWAGELDRMREN